MKKLFALLTTSVLFTGLSAGVSARESADQNLHQTADVSKTPVVQVYELTDEQVMRLIEARAEYRRDLIEKGATDADFSIDELLGLATQ